MWLGGKLSDSILEFIKNEKPDILAVQEVYDSKDEKLEKRFHLIEIIKEECNFQHVFFSPACMAILPEGKIPAGNAIFSRFPFLNSETTFTYSEFKEISNYEMPDGDFSLTPRNLQYVMLEINDVKVNVFNTQGVWGKDSYDNKNKLEMSEKIVQEIENKSNVILAGDFNALPNTKTMLNIGKGLRNVFRDKLKTTFNVRRKKNPIFSNLVVDMVFTSNNIKVSESYCPNVDISDHLPLVVVFEI